MLESGKHGAGVMPGILVGMDRRAMPRVAVVNTSECVCRAELVDGRVRPKVGSGCEAKGSKAKQGFV